MLFRKLLNGFFLACILYSSVSATANDIIQIRFSSDAAVPTITPVSDSLVTVSFSDTDLTNIFLGYTIKACSKSYPLVSNIAHPLSPALNRVYEFILASGGSSLMTQLNAYVGSSITNKYLRSPLEELVIPNDYDSDVIPCGSSGQLLKHLQLIGASSAWDITTGNSSIKIAVTDNGFNKNHEDLIGKIANPGTVTGYSAHGTGVAGQVAANTNNDVGLSAIGYDCQLLIYFPGFYFFPEAILAGAKIINCSWTNSCAFNQNDQNMIDIAYDMGVIVVAAAGNGGTCGGPINYVYPASYDHVISVTGVGHYFPRNQPDPCNGKINHEDVHLYRANSNAPYQTLQHNDKVDLAAPGYEVRSLSLTGYWNISGSSFAAPIVSGVCGLLFSINSNFTPDEIEGILKCTASDLDNIPENASYAGLLGAGRVDAYQAVLKAQSIDLNKPTDIVWFYYDNLGRRVDFDPNELYVHVQAGAIAGNTIFLEATSRISGISFDWEFIKATGKIQKSGNPVSFNLSTELPYFWCNLVAHVKNDVLNICDPNASAIYREAAYLDEISGCWEPNKVLIQSTPAELKEEIDGIRLYPNPATSIINLVVLDATAVRQAALLSVTRQVIRIIQLKGNRTAINVSGIPSGVYFLKLDQKTGTMIKKIMIIN